MNYPKLEIELKYKWITALRSGEYEQGYGTLYDMSTENYCCLGVLEHICGTPIEDMSDEDNEIVFPKDVSEPKSPEFLWGNDDDDSPAMILANMNDGNIDKQIKKHNFNEIADWISLNL